VCVYACVRVNSNGSARAEEQGADGSKYASSGVVCFNLPNGTLKWHTPLDLSFADRAYSPYVRVLFHSLSFFFVPFLF